MGQVHSSEVGAKQQSEALSTRQLFRRLVRGICFKLHDYHIADPPLFPDAVFAGKQAMLVDGLAIRTCGLPRFYFLPYATSINYHGGPHVTMLLLQRCRCRRSLKCSRMHHMRTSLQLLRP